MGLSALEICAIVFASIFVLIAMIKCCMTVSAQNKVHSRGTDCGHDNAVYVLPQNEISFLQEETSDEADSMISGTASVNRQLWKYPETNLSLYDNILFKNCWLIFKPDLSKGRSYGATYTQSSGYPLAYNIHGSNTPVYYYPQPASPILERRDPIFPPSYPHQHYANAPPPPPYSDGDQYSHQNNQHSVFLKS